MFHKVKGVAPLPDLELGGEFAEGVTKFYDVAPPMEGPSMFRKLEDEALFSGMQVDAGGYRIVCVN